MPHSPQRTSSDARRALAVLCVFLLAGAVVLAVFLTWADQLPDPLATHFGGGGKPDGFTGHGAFLAIALGVLAGGGALFGTLVLMTRGATGPQRILAGVGSAVAVLMCFLVIALLSANAEATEVSAVRLPGWQVGAAFGAAAVAGAAAWLLCGIGATAVALKEHDTGPVERLHLTEGERATWTHLVGSKALPVTGLAIVVLGVVFACVAYWLPAILLLVAGVPLLALTRARVTVDQRGVTVASSVIPRPRLNIPLDRVAEATHREVDARREFGGWGYRASPGASGLVLRSGDAISMRLTTGSEFIVTVDDAATAAALLNALAERERTPGG